VLSEAGVVGSSSNEETCKITSCTRYVHRVAWISGNEGGNADPRWFVPFLRERDVPPFLCEKGGNKNVRH